MEFPRIKVLMLCWEFPPMVAGGLGPACYGLAKALSPFVDLTIILPKSEAGFKMNRINIIGLNHFSSDGSNHGLVLQGAKNFFSHDLYNDEEWAALPEEIRISLPDSSTPGQLITLLNEYELY